jgi:hypothetical protein
MGVSMQVVVWVMWEKMVVEVTPKKIWRIQEKVALPLLFDLLFPARRHWPVVM